MPTARCSVLVAGHDDVFLSFLPLSHTFERTCGYYLTIMTGSHDRLRSLGIPQLGGGPADDAPDDADLGAAHLRARVRPRSAPRSTKARRAKKKLFLLAVEVGYARFEHAQGRGPWKPSFLLWPVLNALVAKKILARLGGRMRAAISGGAALPPDISRVFIGLGLDRAAGLRHDRNAARSRAPTGPTTTCRRASARRCPACRSRSARTTRS